MNPSLTTAWWADGYARCGWRVFPVKPREKSPVYNNWQKDATTDPEMCRRYWPEALGRNLGVVCGEKFDAWDIEVQHLEAFGELWRSNGPGWGEALGSKRGLPETPIARTGRGGMHIFTEPTGVNGTRYLYLDGVHIGELKSTGGFILACPSVTEGQYSWTWAPDHLEVQPAPAWLLGLLERPKGAVHKFPTSVHTVEEGMRRLGALTATVQSAAEGQRNSYLYWAMRRALEEGVPPEIATESLRQAGELAGLTDHETKMTLHSAYVAESAS